MRLHFIKDIKKSGSSCGPFDGTKLYVDTGSVERTAIVDATEVTYAEKPSRANLSVHVDDVLFAKMQGTIKVLHIDALLEKNVYSTGFYSFRDERLLPRYLRHFFLSPHFNIEKDRLSKGATMKAINDEGMSQISIPVYSLTRQGEIASTLDSIENQIRLTQRQICHLDEQVKSLFNEMFGNLWESDRYPLMKFLEFAEFHTCMTTDFDKYADYPHIGIDNIEKETGRLFGYKTVAEDGVISGKYLFGPEDIIYSKIRPNLNKVALPDFNGVCSADAYPIRPRANSNRVFLAYLLRSRYFLDYILTTCNRAGMPKTNKDSMAAFQIHIPPKEEQDAFAARVVQIDKLRFT